MIALQHYKNRHGIITYYWWSLWLAWHIQGLRHSRMEVDRCTVADEVRGRPTTDTSRTSSGN